MEGVAAVVEEGIDLSFVNDDDRKEPDDAFVFFFFLLTFFFFVASTAEINQIKNNKYRIKQLNKA